MLYSEFAAVLDGVVAIPELAGARVAAAYVAITPALKISALVTFYLDFNMGGYADERWNVPIIRLVETADLGPDMGAGPVQLACRSQCPEPRYQEYLWEPNQGGIDHFKLLAAAISHNKLGLLVAKDPSVQPGVADNIPVLGDDVAVPLISDTVSLTADEPQPLAVDSETSKIQQQLVDERARNQELARQLVAQETLLADLKAANTKLERGQIGLQDKLESQQQQVEQQRAREQQMNHAQRAKNEENNQKIVVLKEELTLKLSELEELQEQLAELATHNEGLQKRLAEFDDQLAAAEAAITQAVSLDDVTIFKKIKDLELVVVAYHPGAGHISLPARELEDYLAKPLAVAAQKCGVTLELYEAWLAHYQNKQCDECGANIKAVNTPANFQPGIDDRCEKHRQSNDNIALFRRP